MAAKFVIYDNTPSKNLCFLDLQRRSILKKDLQNLSNVVHVNRKLARNDQMSPNKSDVQKGNFIMKPIQTTRYDCFAIGYMSMKILSRNMILKVSF